jgi:hypothetical protein
MEASADPGSWTYHGLTPAPREQQRGSGDAADEAGIADAMPRELDDEELDLVSGGAAPTEEEPFQAASYPLN